MRAKVKPPFLWQSLSSALTASESEKLIELDGNVLVLLTSLEATGKTCSSTLHDSKGVGIGV